VTLVNTVATALADQPLGPGVRAAVDALAAAGVPAAIETDGLSYGEADGERMPLLVDGSTVGTLVLANAPDDLARSLVPLFSLALAARAQSRAAKLLDSVVESVGDGILVYANGDCVSTNAAARRLLGIGDEMPSTEAFEPRHLDGRSLASEEYPAVKAHATGEPQPYRLRARLPNGDDRVFAGTVSPVLNGKEDVGTVVLFRDATEEIERELLSQRFLERLVDAVPTAVTICEPGSWRILSANAAMRALVGYGDDQILGAEPPYPWWGEPPVRPPEEWTPTDRWEQLYRHADGTVVPVEGTTFMFHGADGEPERVINLVTDLSERRLFEQQLVQSSKLASIGELAAGVAHEINNPLFAILGLVEFLLKDAQPGTKAHERLVLVQQTGLEIKEIVRALLDFARERSDEFAPVALELAVRQTLDLVRKTSAKKGIEIVERYPEEELVVQGSSNQLKQVILNVVTNAQHAMPEGGRITIELARDGDYATATVTDTGAGVPAEVVERIFDPFFTTKREVGGTGLGLSVSLGIAQMHGGDLTVDSQPGHGASFTLRLPLAS
jgi:PAS domain S-box-containing protein